LFLAGLLLDVPSENLCADLSGAIEIPAYLPLAVRVAGVDFTEWWPIGAGGQ